ncbi:ABC transporter permease [Streptomyces somaliensis]|uniref:FtsX-like permease family protein n=1 Tax=Streptomyces somaliensis TaxID=78355 RepID=UPI0020CB6A71|nr:ABC transporter permease [Streptomyces somaliensis]MCP9944824.1 ABC transporter permease [Streptomyces somaliensis]MCP9961946.1 ABC transporter permease [Streptomyces somaliensis]MCP9974770.1 ABC transporter permease [Streptomyces somaliensis]
MFSFVLDSCRSRLGQYAGSLLVVVMMSALFTALATIVDRVHRAGLGHGPERSAESLMGLVGGTSGLAALLLVGNTLALVVRRRRREIGVLRTIGATPIQVGAGIVAEMSVIALAGGVAGAVAGSLCAGSALDWLVANKVFPPGPEAGFSPQGFVIGVLSTVGVAVLATLVSVRRPARTSPLSGLREAEVERGVMPVGRMATAVLTLVLAGAVWQRYEHESGADQAVNGAVGLCLFLLLSAWLLAPLLVRPLVVPGALPGLLLSRYSGRLAAVTSIRSARRVAAMSGPVLIAVGLSAALLCSGAASDAIIRSQASMNASATAAPPVPPPSASSTGTPTEAGRAEDDGADISALREQQRRNEVGTRVLMTPLIVFSAIGILNTLLLTTRQRRGEFAVLRLTGATSAQLLRMLLWESVVVVVGAVLTASAVLGVFLSVLSRRLAPHGVDFDSLVPGETLAQVVSSCAALGLLGVLVPGVLVLRVRPVQAARTRD